MNTIELRRPRILVRAARGSPRAASLLPLAIAGALASVPAPAVAQAFTLPQGVGAVTLATPVLRRHRPPVHRRNPHFGRANRDGHRAPRGGLRRHGPVLRDTRSSVHLREVQGRGAPAADPVRSRGRVPLLELVVPGLRAHRPLPPRGRPVGRHAAREVHPAQPRLQLPGGGGRGLQSPGVRGRRHRGAAARGPSAQGHAPGRLHVLVRREVPRDSERPEQRLGRDRVRRDAPALPPRERHVAVHARRPPGSGLRAGTPSTLPGR